jgi:hypothetical protein
VISNALMTEPVPVDIDEEETDQALAKNEESSRNEIVKH